MKWPPWRREVEPTLTSDLPAGVLALARHLPEPQTLRRRCQALAMLEAIDTEAPEERYFLFDAHWGVDQDLASMSDGEGNEWSITFTPDGVWLRGFAHDSPLSPWREPHDLDWLTGVPEQLQSAAAEPAFTGDDHDGQTLPLVTVACWWLYGHDDADAPGWHPVPLRTLTPTGVDDGSEDLFTEVISAPKDEASTYVLHGEFWRDIHLPEDAIEHVFALRPLTEQVLRRLESDRALADLAGDIQQIGYPTAQ